MANPNTVVPLEGLAEAAAAGVNLALEDQLNLAVGSEIGPTMGMFPVDP
jgi:hypothetical protein